MRFLITLEVLVVSDGGDSEQSVYDTDAEKDGNLSESRIGLRYRRYSSFQRCSVCVPSTVIVKYSCL